MNRLPGIYTVACAALVSCAGEPPSDGITLLSPREQLIRLSVDLRGVHPSEAELVAIEAHPGLYDEYVDRYLADPRLLDRVEEIWNLRLLTRTGSTYFDPSEAGITGVSDTRVAASLADEPLKLIRRIVQDDLPYSELVLANYTMADPIVAAMWDLDYPAGATDWQPAQYQDGRPMAGLLSMSTIWQRYPSMGGNANRHRANAVSKMLLCDDYLARPIVLNRSNIDQLTVDPEVAILSETCQSCHANLDPLAAHFYGFYRVDSADTGLREATRYLPENEEGWRDYADKPPGYYGRPTANIHELAEAMVQDPRFADCAVQTAWEGLNQRALTDADWTEVQGFRELFLEGGMVVKPMIRAIVTSRTYLAGAVAEADDRVATVKTASPAQLAGIIEGITQYRWTFNGEDGLTDPTNGLGILAGGVDGEFVTVANYKPSVGSVFVQERLAQTAAYSVAVHDLDPARTEPAILLTYVTAATTPDTAPEVFDAQVRDLYPRVTGLALPDDAPEPEQLASLWRQVYSVEASTTQAWAGVVSAVLRDPRVLFY